ncbi:MAG: helix-turn-helix domain-containing protein [Clostridia bacterium]|nr:helix-turn-helix domain-containing protein [Clostridia bacterium]
MRMHENVLLDDYDNVMIRSYHSLLPTGTRAYREHHHTECELSLFLSGRGLYAVHGKSYEFEPGSVFLFGSNEAHCITEIHEDFDLLNIQFESRLLWEHSETVELLNLFAARNKNFSNRIAVGDSALNELIRSLECELTDHCACRAVQSKYILFSALVHIIRNYDYINPEKTLNAPSSATGSLKRAIRYINENLEHKLTLREIADVACMTPTYFSAVFKKFNGISPWDYITIKRVEKTVEMLKTTDLTKLEIAERCGFSSSSNFYKAFYHVTGKSPGDYQSHV